MTITHPDLSYMQKHYETSYRPELNAESTGKDDDEAFQFAEKSFRPLYYIKEYEEDRSKIEMSFDLTQYVAPRALGATSGARQLTDQLPAAVPRHPAQRTCPKPHLSFIRGHPDSFARRNQSRSAEGPDGR